MHIVPRSFGSTTILDCRGSFNPQAGRVMREAIETALNDGCEHLVLNLEEMDFSDSMTIGLLVVIQKDFEAWRDKVSLLQPQRLLRRALQDCNLQSMLRIYETEAAALAHSLVPA